MTQPKPNRDDWKDSGGGWFPPSTVPTSDLNDYKEWANAPGGWAMLKAAVNGGSGISTDAQMARASGLVNPQSLVDGAAAFQRTYDTLSWLETFVRDHSKAIAGEGKPWQGQAADAFVAKMEWFAKYLGAQAERISGADGTGGIGSVPNQLNKSANYLAWAQQTLNYLDQSWAAISKAAGSAVGGDGLVSITGTQYEKPMTDQMVQVVDTLAGQYDLTYSSVTPPQGDGSPPITTPNLSDITSPPPPNLSGPPNVSPPNVSTPNFGTGGGGGGGGPNVPTINTPNISTPNFSGPGAGPGGGGPNTPNLSAPNIPAPNIPPPPGGNGGLPGLDLPNGPTGGTGSGGNIPPFVVPPLPKPPGTGSNLPKPPGTGSGPGVGSNPPKPPALPKPPPFEPPKVPPPPTAGTGGGIGNGVDLPGVNGPGAPGGIPGGVPGGVPGGTPGGVPGGAPGGAPGGLGGGLPGGSPGGAPGAGGVNLPDAPDAGGLLTGDQSDWQPTAVGGVDVPDAPGGAHPGGTGLGGFPGGAPGGAPSAGGGVNLPDAPDAGGLLTGDANHWHAQDLAAVDGPEAPGGALPGGAGLGAGPQAPGAAGGTTLPERPDAAGLIDGDETDWSSPDGVTGPDAPAGANPGGAGLATFTRMPVAEPVADRLAPQAQPESPAAYAGAGTPKERTAASNLIEADAEVWAPDAPMVPVNAIDVPESAEKEDERRKHDALVAVPVIPVNRSQPVEEVELVVPAVPSSGDEKTETAETAAEEAVQVPARATGEVDERAELDRPDTAELLTEETDRWTPESGDSRPENDGDHVPVVRPDESVGDTTGWDDGADWLNDERLTDV